MSAMRVPPVLFVLTIASLVDATAATVTPRLRPVEAGVDALIAQGQLRSPTFARLAAAVEESDVIVYIKPSYQMPRGLVGKLRFITLAGRFRVVEVAFDAGATLPQRLSVLAHELQHVLEIAAAPQVTSEAGLRDLYRRIGMRSSESDKYETAGAIAIGARVLAETARQVASRSRPTASASSPS